MAEGGNSAFFKVGPNYAEANHEPGRGQDDDALKKSLSPRNHAEFRYLGS